MHLLAMIGVTTGDGHFLAEDATRLSEFATNRNLAASEQPIKDSNRKNILEIFDESV